MLKSPTEPPPSCFGKLFDNTAVECTGGFDANWTGGVGGSRIRPVCDVFDACGSKTYATKQQQVIPASNLIRPQPHTTFGGSNAPPGYARPPTPLQQRPWAPPSQQVAQAPPHYPQSYQQPAHFATHYGIPQYLTVRQPVNSGPIVERMWWEVFRSIGKAIGHTLANFFDQEIFGRHGGPGSGNNSG